MRERRRQQERQLEHLDARRVHAEDDERADRDDAVGRRDRRHRPLQEAEGRGARPARHDAREEGHRRRQGPGCEGRRQRPVQYVGVAQSTGKQFDASWDRGQAFDFPLGQGEVIPGWDEGIVGMKVGGRRQLTIPPDQAYGAQGAPPDIGPNETLVFVVDLKKIN